MISHADCVQLLHLGDQSSGILTATFLSALELGALLSSYLEGALYKFLNE